MPFPLDNTLHIFYYIKLTPYDNTAQEQYMKKIKKLFIIIPSAVFAVFLLLLTAPFLFKGKLLEIVKKELNRTLTAKVGFSDLKLSFIRNFPNAYIALENLKVDGTGEFDGETLLEFKSLSVTVDIISVIRMNNIQVKSILLDRAKINARISKTGGANWNIVKPKEETPPPAGIPPGETGHVKPASPLKIVLNKFEIRGANLSFQNDSNNMTAVANGLNFFLSGDMSMDNADLDIKLDIASADFIMNNISMLTKARVGLVSKIAADIKNMEFTLKENRFNLNEIVLKFTGSAGIHEDINIDMAFATEKTDFKSVLSLVPAVYMKDFESITTTGNFTLSGNIKGIYNDKQTPNASVNLAIDNAMFKYPNLPKSVNNINIKAKAWYDGAVFDRTTLDVDKLHFEMAGNPFDAELHVKTPESDMQVAAKFSGKIDFNSLLDVIPLDDITLKGLLECDLALAGRMSSLEKKRYDNFDAKGTVKLSGVDFKSPGFPKEIKIAGIRLDFTPRRVELKEFNAIIGNSDISLEGMLENFIPFVFKGGTVSGSLNLKSNKIDLNEFMSSKETAEKPKQTAEETSSLSVIEVPKNIDFAVKAAIDRLLFDKLDITGIAGTFLMKNGKLQMQNLDMNMLTGSVRLSGEYNTQDIKVPSVNLDANIKQVDIPSAIASFDILQKILPDPRNYEGKVSANMVLSASLDEHLNPALNTVNSKGQLQTHSLKIQNSPLLGAMADLLKNEDWRAPAFNDINIRYEIKNGKLTIEPVRMNIGQAGLELTGSQGLDMSLNYKINAGVPVSMLGTGAVGVLEKIPGGSKLKEIKVSGLMGGTALKPAVSLSFADTAEGAIGAVKETAKEQVQAVNERAKEETEKQINAVLEEAEKQAQNIRNTAKQTADKIRDEADTAAKKLEDSAKSPLEQVAAKAAANKLREEGRATAAKTEQEAEKQATAIMDNARKKADELRK